MKDNTKQNFLNESYPQLTVPNVRHWYWEVEPHWSGHDIANAVGCKPSSVYYFMRKHNIPRRSSSEANNNRFNCPQKYEKFKNQMNSPELREHQSIKSIEVWQNSINRARYIKSFQERESKRLSDYHKLILFLLLQQNGLFFTDFMQILSVRKRSLYETLLSLYKREMVSRTKEYNEATASTKKYQFRYEITEKGKELLLIHMNEASFNYEELLKSVQAQYGHEVTPSKRKKTNTYISIGKNQQVILRVLQQQDRPLFLLDFVSLMTLSKKVIGSSLSILCKRGFLSREKEFNPKYTGKGQNTMQYRYSLTKDGEKLLATKLK